MCVEFIFTLCIIIECDINTAYEDYIFTCAAVSILNSKFYFIYMTDIHIQIIMLLGRLQQSSIFLGHAQKFSKLLHI